MVAEPVVVSLGREAPVLCPLDLRREVAGRPEAERPRERVADPAEKQSLRGEDPSGISLEMAKNVDDPAERLKMLLAGKDKAAHPFRGF